MKKQNSRGDPQEDEPDQQKGSIPKRGLKESQIPPILSQTIPSEGHFRIPFQLDKPHNNQSSLPNNPTPSLLLPCKGGPKKTIFMVGWAIYLWWCSTKHIKAMIIPLRIRDLANTGTF